MGSAVGLRSLTLLFGAGYGGSYVYNNTEAARDLVVTQLGKALVRVSDSKDNGSKNNNINNNPDESAIRALSDKVNSLALNVSRTADRPVVVLGPGSSRVSALADALSLAGWAVLAVGCGSAAYYVAIWKGWSVKDLAWVSQTSFDSTIDSMQAGIAKVSGVVSAVRREFGERFKYVEARVEAVRAALSTQIETEIGQVKHGIEEVSADVATVHQVLADVTGRIDAIDGKLDTATNGIMALVRVVSSLAPDSARPGNPFWELKQIADNGNKTPLIADSQPLLRKRVSFGIGGILTKDPLVNGIKEASDNNFATVPISPTIPR